VYTPDRGRARTLDAADPLAPFLDRFVAPPQRVIYLDGNSLGMLPKDTREALRRAVDHEWGQRLIRSWTEGWMELPHTLGDRLGNHLLGAAQGQVLIADSTTVCFYKLASAAIAARPGRARIVTDTDNFPTDRYVLEALAQQHGLTIDWIQSDPYGGPEAEQVAQAIAEDTALVTFSHTSYRSAHIADMQTITELAHAHGALILWDLSHTVGSVPVNVDAAGVDLAVGCTYKYLNAGPGAPAFLYVNQRLQHELSQPIWGWLGRRDAFAMAPGYDRAPGIGQMLSGTPSILGLTAARTGIELSIEAGIDAIRAKSTKLTEYAIELIDAVLETHGVSVGSPRDPRRRGGHVALVHPDARALVTELADEHQVITDFREPDVIRFGLSPLTTRFIDIHDAVERLVRLLSTRG
jgi:kynureninase